MWDKPGKVLCKYCVEKSGCKGSPDLVIEILSPTRNLRLMKVPTARKVDEAEFVGAVPRLVVLKHTRIV